MTMTEPTRRAPDIDRTIHYQSFGDRNRRPGVCRMRVWVVEHVVVVTELDDNPGASVTNSIESIAEVVDAQLGIDLAGPDVWRLVEHYPANRVRGMTLDRVYVDLGRGVLAAPGRYTVRTWKRLDRGEWRWLYEALA